MPGKRASGEPPQANLINDIKQKRLPVFLRNTTTAEPAVAYKSVNKKTVLFTRKFPEAVLVYCEFNDAESTGFHYTKSKRLPVFLGNTTTPYRCTARSVDDERRVRFSFLLSVTL